MTTNETINLTANDLRALADTMSPSDRLTVDLPADVISTIEAAKIERSKHLVHMLDGRTLNTRCGLSTDGRLGAVTTTHRGSVDCEGCMVMMRQDLA